MATTKPRTISIQNGYVYAEMPDGTKVEAGVDRTFGIRDPQGARYRCNCRAHFDLPRHLAGHLTTGTCPAL